jgi:hypothetical protein
MRQSASNRRVSVNVVSVEAVVTEVAVTEVNVTVDAVEVVGGGEQSIKPTRHSPVAVFFGEHRFVIPVISPRASTQNGSPISVSVVSFLEHTAGQV